MNYLGLVCAILFLSIGVSTVSAYSGNLDSPEQHTFSIILPNHSISNQSTIIPSLKSRFDYQGKVIDEHVIGPGLPPAKWIPNKNLANIRLSSTKIVDSENIPVIDWSYGCSATSASMLFGYYDRVGYSKMYDGPTNNGIFPLTNAAWGSGECPLSASHNGIDGRMIKGHVDDYYDEYRSIKDPYSSNWAEHSPMDSVSDYMGTNQYINWLNSDGSTRFYFNLDGSRLYDFTGQESSHKRDGIHGMKLFAQSKGCTVSKNYNQYIYGYQGNTKGFTYS